MAKAIFKVLLKFISSIVDIILIPIDALVLNAFPDLSAFISRFNYILDNIFDRVLPFFLNLIPPNTLNVLIVFLNTFILLYALAYSIHLTLKVIEIIKKLKIW